VLDKHTRVSLLMRCPVTGCPRVLASRQILCPDHWADVPVDLRKAVRDRKKAQESPEYVEALRDVLAWAETMR
jgi:hypothetical protein